MLQQSPLECIICLEGGNQRSFFCAMHCCGQRAHISCMVENFNRHADRVVQAGHHLDFSNLPCPYCQQPWISLALPSSSSADLTLGLCALVYFARFGGLSFDAIKTWLQNLPQESRNTMQSILRASILPTANLNTIFANLQALGYPFSPNQSLRPSRDTFDRLRECLKQHAYFVAIRPFLNQPQPLPHVDFYADVFDLLSSIAHGYPARYYDANSSQEIFDSYRAALTNSDVLSPIPLAALVPQLNFSGQIPRPQPQGGYFDERVHSGLLFLMVMLSSMLFATAYSIHPAPSSLWFFGESIFLAITGLRALTSDNITFRELWGFMIVFMLMTFVGARYRSI